MNILPPFLLFFEPRFYLCDNLEFRICTNSVICISRSVIKTQHLIGMPSFSLCQIFIGRETLRSVLLLYSFRLECIFLQQIHLLLFTVVAVILSQICRLAAVSVRCSHESFCMPLSYWSYVLVQAKIHYAETHVAMLWLYLSITGKKHQIMCDVFSSFLP